MSLEYVSSIGKKILTSSIGVVPITNSVSQLSGYTINGSRAILRLGTSPFIHIGLLYDATLAKWVSDEYQGPFQFVSTFNTTSTSYAAASDANVKRHYINNFKTIYDSGLRLQVQNSGQIQGGAGIQATAAIAIYEYNAGDTGVTQIGSVVGSEISNNTATATYVVDPMEDFSHSAPAEEHAVLIFQVKVASGTGTFSALTCKYRWISS